MNTREHLLMDKGWSFHEGDIEDKAVHGYMYTYMQTKTERGRGPASIDYDDSGWQKVTLPHDYVVKGKPDPGENHVHGSLKRNNAWYRRFFRLENADKDKRIRITFEGVCSACKVWVNGCLMKYNDSAYTEFEIDITDIARFGDDLNLIAVYIDNSEYEAWWYEGAGIYRHVYLDKLNKLSVDWDGTYVNPRKQETNSWKVEIETILRNDTDFEAEIELLSVLRDTEGKRLAESMKKVRAAPREKLKVMQEVLVENPPVWSLEQPHLCSMHSSVSTKGELCDEYVTSFGFRTIRFDADQGFFLNGIPTKIKGMCIHEDHGGLGVGVPNRVKEYRVRRLKEMGCNGYRFSHNQHSRETLDACDRLGMLVMDENRWFESSEDGKRRVEAMVRRDRNHPSVIIWSMGNEESLQAKETGKRIMNTLKSCVKKLDKTRPVLMAMHTGLLEDGAVAAADMIGMNYNIELCGQVHEKYPRMPIIFSEASNTSEEDVLGNRQAGIDTWKLAATRTYLCGLFAWAGMDYRGEHAYPGLFAPCGAMDQNGYPNDCYYLYQAYWKQEPMVYIQPHWNDPVQPGEQVTVRVFTTGDTVQLFLNGRLLEEQKVDPYEMCNFQVEYQPGVLKAIAKRNGTFEGECERITTKAADHLQISRENESVFANDYDVAICTVTAWDEDGRYVPDADHLFRVKVRGGGELLAVGNGDVCDQSERTKPECRLYKGRAQVLIRSMEKGGDIVLEVNSDQLRPASITIPKIAGNKVREAGYDSSRYLNRWEVSDWLPDMPEVSEGGFQHLAPFSTVEIGHGTNMHDLSKNSGYFVYHTVAELPEFEGVKDICLQFELLEGQSWLYVNIRDDDKYVRYTGHKEKEEPEEYSMELKNQKGGAVAEVWVLLHVWMPFCGITKPVRWEIKEAGDKDE